MAKLFAKYGDHDKMLQSASGSALFINYLFEGSQNGLRMNFQTYLFFFFFPAFESAVV